MMKFFTSTPISLHKLYCFVILILMVCACKKETEIINIPVSGPNQIFYALSENSLLRFNALDVKSLPTKIAITGLSPAEKMLSIDFRPATGELYGVSNTSKIYIIDGSGVARATSSTPFNPALADNATVSLDFNPTVDKIRIVTSTGQNLRLNPETGMVISSDNTINGVSGAAISGIAYTNSIAGATTTVLYDIDTKTKKLYKQEPANNGTLIEVGNLGLELGLNVSLDISNNNTNALAIGKFGDSTKLFTIDLAKGKATLAGKFPLGTSIQGIAMPLDAVAYAVDKNNNFLIFNPQKNTAPISKAIIGLQSGETVLAMDMRPLNGAIYALGSSSRLYTIDMSSGVFTQVGSGALSPLLVGSSFGFDFNPMKDRIRVVSNTGQNLEIDPSTAAVTTEANTTLSTATLGAAAFSNNFKNATTTTLYVIDYTSDKLYSQDPSTGVLTAIGDLKINTSNIASFDIYSNKLTNEGYAALEVAGVMDIYRINLTTGEAAIYNSFPTPVNFTAFTLGLRLP